MGLQDRKKTIEQFKTFLDTKIAPKEFVDEIKVYLHISFPLLAPTGHQVILMYFCSWIFLRRSQSMMNS